MTVNTRHYWLSPAVTSIICSVICLATSNLITDETQAVVYLKDANEKVGQYLRKGTQIQWNYNVNITKETTDAVLKVTEEVSKFQKQQLVETLRYDWSSFDEYNKRQFEKLAVIGTGALSEDDGKQFSKVSSDMETIYSSAKVCVANQCGLELDPDLSEMLAHSKDYDTLKEVWINWRDATGKKMRDKYITYFTLGNKAATLNKVVDKTFKTLDELWLYPWETPDIKEQTAALWEKLRPFYQKIHAYVRVKLNNVFPGKMPKDNTIPAHLLGNMWAQSWSNIMKTVPGVDPYPEIAAIDVTKELVDQGYDANKMFEMSDKFFGDLGLDKMTDIFWKKSVLVKPSDNYTVMVCHASAWDFYIKDDFRIKQCTKINMEDLITIHHEMGHIEYYMQYQKQPILYREGANPGFHEAIGDLLALSVSTPKHLQKIGLLKGLPSDMTKINIKYQLKMALDKFAFLPFGYIMDKWRWDVFSGQTPSSDMNRRWWQLRLQYQGLSPPVKRSENDFDPGAKYHISASVEYIRYFVSHILQFQFHKALCDIAQPGVPLHECDIDGNKPAGNKLKEVLKLGSSMKWPQQLKMLTGSDTMDVQPLLDYFKPLNAFLDNELKHISIGWNATVDDYFDSSADASTGGSAQSFMHRNSISDLFNILLFILICLVI